jgi:hypothetical protein
LRIPRTKEFLASWMSASFSAGHDVGRAHPEVLEEVLPGPELRLATRRLDVIQRCCEERNLTRAGFRRAFEKVISAQWADVEPDGMMSVLLEAVVKAFRGGFAAATAAQSDPVFCELVWDMPARLRFGSADRRHHFMWLDK